MTLSQQGKRWTNEDMDSFDKEYENATGRMQDFRLVLERLIQLLLEAEGIRVHSVTGRVKSKNSVIRKLERPDKARTIATLTDLLGIRIITYFRDEVDAVAKLIEREFLIDPVNSIDKRAVLDSDRFGYLSLHYIAQLNRNRSTLAEHRNYKDIRFELQIRSILQHAWAEIEHDLGYKPEAAVPNTVTRRFSRLAGLLELADDEFLRLRDELTPSTDAERSRLGSLEADIDRLLARPAVIRLPAWQQNWSESEYIVNVADADPGFLPMDASLIRTPSSRGGFTPCDLLGPHDELIHIRRPTSGASFGHLFNQALISSEILLDSAAARNAFADEVNRLDSGRALSPEFRPREVVVAFPSGTGPTVPQEVIPIFARVTLSRIFDALEGRGVILQVVGIDEQLSDGGANPPHGRRSRA